jgi:hypothetical protein
VVDWADWAGRDPTDIRVKVFYGQELVGFQVESDQRLRGRACPMVAAAWMPVRRPITSAVTGAGQGQGNEAAAGSLSARQA